LAGGGGGGSTLFYFLAKELETDELLSAFFDFSILEIDDIVLLPLSIDCET
jgi:hypothetical protein